MTLAARIKSYREARGLSPVELANVCGLSGDGARRIQRYEKSERTPGVDEIVQLARGLNCSLQQLMTGETAPVIVQQVALDAIKPDPEQPRRIDPADPEQAERIQQLAASIRTHGVLQPVTVRPAAGGNGYTIIYGERRWRAAGQADLSTIPAIVRTDVEDESDRLAVQILENLHRVDLPLTDVIDGMAQLARSRTHDGLASELGKSRSWVSRRVALAECATPVRGAIKAGHIHDVDLAHGYHQLHELEPETAAHYLASLENGTRYTREAIQNRVKTARAMAEHAVNKQATTGNDGKADRQTAEAQRKADERANDTSGGYGGAVDDAPTGPAEVTGRESAHAADREERVTPTAEQSSAWENVLFNGQKLVNAQISVNRAVHELNMTGQPAERRRDPDPKTLREHIDAAIADLTTAAESLRLKPPTGPGLFDKHSSASSDTDDPIYRNARHVAQRAGVMTVEDLRTALNVSHYRAGVLIELLQNNDVIGPAGDDGQHYINPDHTGDAA